MWFLIASILAVDVLLCFPCFPRPSRCGTLLTIFLSITVLTLLSEMERVCKKKMFCTPGAFQKGWLGKNIWTTLIAYYFVLTFSVPAQLLHVPGGTWPVLCRSLICPKSDQIFPPHFFIKLLVTLAFATSSTSRSHLSFVFFGASSCSIALTSVYLPFLYISSPSIFISFALSWST